MTPHRLVAIVGAGTCDPEIASLAEEAGRRLAFAGAVLLTGGLGGVMEAASRGAAQAGGLTVGLLPGPDRGAANPWVRIAIATDLGHSRNVVIARSADAIIAIAGETGTLSEIALGLKCGKRVVGLRSWEIPGVLRAGSPEEAVHLALGG